MTADATDETEARLRERIANIPLFEPVDPSPADIQRFLDHDLASLAEIRFGDPLDPASIDASIRRTWTERATHPGELSATDFVSAYWLRERNERIGTVSWWMYSNDLLGRFNVASLYVTPAHRRRGHARRALLALRDAAFAEGLRQVRLETSWYSPAAVRFYCRLGMWILGWKRDLMFGFDRDLPAWRVEFAGSVARFLVEGEQHPLIVAEQRGNELGWDEQPVLATGAFEHLAWRAPGTFAVALALEGWPLIRSQHEWTAQLAMGFSDVGGPEGLAFKIRHWEDWAARNRWTPPSPKIPGLV